MASSSEAAWDYLAEKWEHIEQPVSPSFVPAIILDGVGMGVSHDIMGVSNVLRLGESLYGVGGGE